MDNRDNKEQKRMQALMEKHIDGYGYGQPCAAGGSTDSGTPLDTQFFGVRMLNGDIHNLTGMHRADRIIADAYITADGVTHTSLKEPRSDVLRHYQNDEDYDVDCIVVLKMLPFTHYGGRTFYTNDWSRPIKKPITPLVEVVAELSDITIDTPAAEWSHPLEAVPIPSGQYDLTEVMA